MFLSKISLAWPVCRDPYQWHRAIWGLFPNEPDANREFLFACLDRRTGVDTSAILLSVKHPVPAPGSATILGESKTLSALGFQMGQRLGFRLTANPTKVLTENNEAKRKIRVPFIKAEQQVDWLRRKLLGTADVVAVEPHNEPPLYFSRKGHGGKIVPVTFEGILTITDPARFMDVYRSGIGPAKAFGCGLLLIKPA